MHFFYKWEQTQDHWHVTSMPMKIYSGAELPRSAKLALYLFHIWTIILFPLSQIQIYMIQTVRGFWKISFLVYKVPDFCCLIQVQLVLIILSGNCSDVFADESWRVNLVWMDGGSVAFVHNFCGRALTGFVCIRSNHCFLFPIRVTLFRVLQCSTMDYYQLRRWCFVLINCFTV